MVDGVYVGEGVQRCVDSQCVESGGLARWWMAGGGGQCMLSRHKAEMRGFPVSRGSDGRLTQGQKLETSLGSNKTLLLKQP